MLTLVGLKTPRFQSLANTAQPPQIGCSQAKSSLTSESEQWCYKDAKKIAGNVGYWELAVCTVHQMANRAANKDFPPGWFDRNFGKTESYSMDTVSSILRQYVIAAEKALIPEYVLPADMETVIRWMTTNHKQWSESLTRTILWNLREGVRQCAVSPFILQPASYKLKALRNEEPEVKKFLDESEKARAASEGWQEKALVYAKWAGIGAVVLVGGYALSNVTRFVRTFKSGSPS